MILIHEKAVRGLTRTGWLDSRHTFSFGGFSDPARMGFGNIRVINEDHIIPNAGFAPHRHENMDILTYVLGGRIRHRDSAGHVSEIGAGEVQLMRAGAGIEHSESNASDRETAHLLQIWLIPDRAGGASGYVQAQLPPEGDVLLAGPAGSGALTGLRSQTRLWLRRAAEGAQMPLDPGAEGLLFVQIVDGLAYAEGERVSAGDGLQLPAGQATALDWASDGAALVFAMPAPHLPH